MDIYAYKTMMDPLVEHNSITNYYWLRDIGIYKAVTRCGMVVFSKPQIIVNDFKSRVTVVCRI